MCHFLCNKVVDFLTLFHVNFLFIFAEALELVSTAANHTNEAMKKIDKFKKLLEIQESIYDSTDLVSATRELVKEGRIVKISARSGDHQERHMFLVSSKILYSNVNFSNIFV